MASITEKDIPHRIRTKMREMVAHTCDPSPVETKGNKGLEACLAYIVDSIPALEP